MNRRLKTVAATLFMAVAALSIMLVPAAALAQPAPPVAAPHIYVSPIQPLNNSGVAGIAILAEQDNQLRVILITHGLEPGVTHAQHIHGFLGTSGPTHQSVCPPPSAATNGIISFADGLPYYGPVVVPLTPYPMVGQNGIEIFVHTFSLPANFDSASAYTIVLHGLTLNGTYSPSTPVACGAIRL